MIMRAISMKKLKEVLRLKVLSGLSNRKISRAVNISAGTVSHYMSAWRTAELNQDALDWDEDKLNEALLPHCQQRTANKAAGYVVPDFGELYQELKQKGVTRQLLWEEYKSKSQGKTYSYTEFCRQYRAFLKTLKPSMRQTHYAGEKCFIDYCGPRIPLYDKSGHIIAKAYVFVATLGASNYIFAWATLTRNLSDWISANVAALNYFGGVPAMMIPDNEKSGVKDACYYDPDVNATYADFARHYDTVILPTRPGCPKDKSKVEKAVQVVETWIMAKLRHHRFRSLHELNEAIRPLLSELNQKPFQKLPGTRQSQFDAIDKPALKPLPRDVYEYATYQKVNVELDYHVTINEHHYSVPQQFIGKQLEARITSTSVELIFKGNVVARHQRDDTPGESSTDTSHMPKAHQAHHEWTPARFKFFAEHIGPSMTEVAQQLLAAQRNPECLYRIHNGFRHLVKRYGQAQLEQACCYALSHQAIRYKYIEHILKVGLATNQDKLAANDNVTPLPQTHQHIRGAQHYQKTTEQKITGETEC